MRCQPQNPVTDFQELLKSAAAGSDAARQELTQRYGDAIYRVVRLRLSSALRRRFDSDDFVQEVWVSFFKRDELLSRFDDATQLIAWLKTVAANKVIDECRRSLTAQKRDARKERSADTWRIPPLELVAQSTAESPASELIREESISSLNSSDRRLVRLLLDGATQAEAATILGVSERTVRRALRRIKDQEPSQ